jgi:hypothetical protein
VDNHEPALYYTCALTWYMFEKAFREYRIDSKYKVFKSHLYMIFRHGAGQLPSTFKCETRAVRSYCDTLIGLLSENIFYEQVQTTLEVFDQAQTIWAKRGKSSHGIKDNKEFTDLLLELLRPQVSTTKAIDTKEVEEKPMVYEGRIVNIIWRNGIWFGFIKRGAFEENIYFDDRGYLGDPNILSNYSQVRYEIGRNQQGDMAINIVLVDKSL